jgi:hypothetical protein
MQDIAILETEKNPYGKVTTANLLRRLINDFIKNYDFKETK